MDANGNLYMTKQLEKALEEAEVPPVSGVRVVSEKKLARIAVKPGASSLTEDELRHLATLPRRARRAALAQLRRR